MKLTVLRFFVVALSIACTVVVVGSLRNPQAATERNNFDALYASLGMPIPAQAGAAEKTVAQAGLQKNIKVLGDLPESQFGVVMNYFAASMGRRCDFCHAMKDNRIDFTLDDKPEKNTAREMIKMVLDTNKGFFKGNPSVGCYTCHRGRNNPQGVPTLPLPAPQGNQGGPRPGGAGTPAQPGAQPQGSPSPRPTPIPADDILNKYINAVGGQAAIDKIKSRSIKGTVVGSNGQSMTYEAIQSGPDKAYESYVTNQGSMERAVVGDTGWEKNPRGVSELGASQLSLIKQNSLLFTNLKLKEQYTRMRVNGRDKVGDRDAIVVSATRPDNSQERLFFDAENGLLLRRMSFMRTLVGVIPQQVDFQDYRDVDGVKMPFTIVVASMNVNAPISTAKYDEIKLNPPVDDSKFKMPAATPPKNP